MCLWLLRLLYKLSQPMIDPMWIDDALSSSEDEIILDAFARQNIMIPVAFAGDISDSWSLSYYVCQSLDICTDDILFQIMGIVWTIRLMILVGMALR